MWGAVGWVLLSCVSIVHSEILIKGGTVVNADRQFRADVLIQGGKIAKLGTDLDVREGVRVVDAEGLLVMPGGIDPHTHLEMPFMGTLACDDFFTGQAAALAGGTTMHIDFALPLDGDLIQGYKNYQDKAKKSCMDYGFHMAITTWNEKVSKDMEHLVNEGINSFKFFMAYKGALMVTDEQLLNGLDRCRTLGAIPMVHAENGDAVVLGQERVFQSGMRAPVGHALSRPAGLEAEATSRALRLAEFIQVPLFVVHVTSQDAMLEVSRAKLRGQPVIGEALCVGLSMNGDRIKDPDFGIAAQGDADRAALKGALAGGILDLVGTDHAVFNSTQKAAGKQDFRKIPNGVNGIEERLHVVWEEMVNTGLMHPMEFVRVTSTQAAKIFNLYPQKGVIEEGADADVIVFDPNREHTIHAHQHHSAMDTNIYEGKKIRGKVVVTISRGRVVWENDNLHVKPETGRFIPMKPFPYLFKPTPVATSAEAPTAVKDEL